MNWPDAPSCHGRFDLAVLGEGTDVDLLLPALKAALRAKAPDAIVARLHCDTADFPSCIAHLQSLGYKGASVGNPLKPEAAKLARDFFVVRHGLGVANALTLSTHIYAQNTEVPAFTAKIASLPPGAALVLGSGRAARSAVQSLFENGWKVRLWNRSVARSKPFVSLFEYYGKVEPVSTADPTGCSLIINATPLGAKAGEEPKVQWERAKPLSTAIDFVYRIVATEFLRKAAQRGFRTVDGRELLVEQAALALEWWTGAEVPRQPMLDAVGLKKLT
jgi:shikimate dehydrogenase